MHCIIIESGHSGHGRHNQFRDDSHREALLVTADVAVKPQVHCDVLRRSEVAPDVAKLLARAGMSWGCVFGRGRIRRLAFREGTREDA